jgi:predicted chitinase
MSGWQWVGLGLAAWCALAVVVALVLGAAVGIADRRERRRAAEAAPRRGEPRGERDWPVAG